MTATTTPAPTIALPPLQAYEQIELYDDFKHFVLVPRITPSFPPSEATPASSTRSDWNNIVVINRAKNQVTKTTVSNAQQAQQLFMNAKSMVRTYGIVGIIELISGPYLIAVIDRDYVGMIKRHRVYCLKKVQMIPFNPRAFAQMDQKSREREVAYLEMIYRILIQERAFYFSYTCDLSVSFQTQSQTEATVEPMQRWIKSSKHFFWNRYLQTPFIDQNLNGYVLPMIRGLVEILPCKIRDHRFFFGIVLRQSCRRAGTRYNMRGADFEGNVANYCETEQFVASDGVFLSYVIVRGSIPVIWTQTANFKYTPEIKCLPDKEKQGKAFRNHFNHMHAQYDNPIVCINLCKEKGQEKRLSDVYEVFCRNTKLSSPLKYVTFDFHHECKNLNYTKVLSLLQRLTPEIKEMRYYVEQYAQNKNEITKDFIRNAQLVGASSKSQGSQGLHVVPSSADLLAFNEVNPTKEQKEHDKNLLEFDDSESNAADSHANSDPLMSFDESAPTPTMSEAEISAEFHVQSKMSKLAVSEPSSPKVQPVQQPTQKTLSTPLHSQTGAFRVNCIDCCDRTNVVSTYISKAVLKRQLQALGIMEKEDAIADFGDFQNVFNNVWANNGDRVSSLYAGTGALMGDYTRTGQRSVTGLLNDGLNSVTRYVKNNFQDAARQRAINLVSGVLDLQSKEEIEAFNKADMAEFFSF